MKKLTENSEFQEAVNKYLIRHQSILDVLSKLQEATSRSNRALIKAITSCGCIKIEAEKQNPPKDATLQELKKYMNTHLQGEICEECQDILETEIGNTLFYLTALCNHLDMDLQKIIDKEYDRLQTLGIYNLL